MAVAGQAAGIGRPIIRNRIPAIRCDYINIEIDEPVSRNSTALSTDSMSRMAEPTRSTNNDRDRSKHADYSGYRFLRPARFKILLTFFGDTESRVATRDIFRPSRSQTLGMINSANCSVIC